MNRIIVHVEVLVEGLWVGVVAWEGVDTVESAVCGVVPAGAEVVMLGIIIEVFAGIKKSS